MSDELVQFPAPSLPPTARLVAIPERRETLDEFEGYPGVEVQVWTNPPERLFTIDALKDEAGEERPAYWLTAQVVKDWNLADPADSTRKRPITPESLQALPTDFLAELTRQYHERRNAPLVRKTKPSSAPSTETATA